MVTVTLPLAFPAEWPVFEGLLDAVADGDVAEWTLTLERPDVSRVPAGTTVTVTRGSVEATVPAVLGGRSCLLWRATVADGDPRVALNRLDAWLIANGDALALAAAGKVRKPPASAERLNRN